MNRFQLLTRTFGAMAVLAWTAPALAQDNPECLGTNCGKPQQQGGGEVSPAPTDGNGQRDQQRPAPKGLDALLGETGGDAADDE